MMTVRELAEKIGGEIEGDGSREVSGVCPLNDIREHCVTYLEMQRDSFMMENKAPAAVICTKAAVVEGQTLIRSSNPKLSFTLALEIFYPARRPEAGIHPTAVTGGNVEIDPSVSVGPNCFVGDNSRIGAGTTLGPNVVVGSNVKIGEGCRLHPNVTVLDGCEIGNRVILHSGVVVGADGFGYIEIEGMRKKVPQVGIVIIEDDVEIGANSAVDRATLGVTRIGRGTKIDNLVQIGHNVKLGEDCVLCGEVGISGSCEIGDKVIFGGQAGVSDHIKIGHGAILGGKSGVISDVPAGAFYSGFPARPHRETMKALSLLKKLPEIVENLEASAGSEKSEKGIGNRED